MSTIQLPAELEKRIQEEAEKKHPFIWPKNKQGEEIRVRVGQSGAPGSAKARKIQRIYIDAVTPYATQLVAAQEKINNLESYLSRIADGAQPFNDREAWSWIETARQLANEALSPNTVVI